MRHCTSRHKSAHDETICGILARFDRIAVVGLSEKPWRDSHRVGSYLRAQGYKIIPINPEISEVLGLRAYPDLVSAPSPIEVVDIFRRKEHLPGIVDVAIQIGAKAIWMQYGLVDKASAVRAERAGLQVVMDRCIMVEHSKHFG